MTAVLAWLGRAKRGPMQLYTAAREIDPGSEAPHVRVRYGDDTAKDREM